MSESRDEMIDALRKDVIPLLRQMGFRGSFPHFRRMNEKQVDLLTFQFNRYGGSFVVEIATAGSSSFTTYWGKNVPTKK